MKTLSSPEELERELNIKKAKKQEKELSNKAYFFINQIKENQNVVKYFEEQYKKNEEEIRFEKIGNDLRKIGYDKKNI